MEVPKLRVSQNHSKPDHSFRIETYGDFGIPHFKTPQILETKLYMATG